MSKSDGSEGRIRISSGIEGRLSRVGGAFLTALILALIFLGAIFFAVRTDEGCDLVAKWLGKRLGVVLTVEKARIGWPYVLVLDNPSSGAFGTPRDPGFRAQEVRIALGLTPRWRVSVLRGVLVLVRGEDGRWQPEPFSRLGDLPLRSIDEVSRATATFRPRTSLRATDCSVRWLDRQGQPVALATGVSFSLSPVKLLDRVMYHHDLSVYEVSVGDESSRDVRRSWLASDSREYVEISRSDGTGARALRFLESAARQTTPAPDAALRPVDAPLPAVPAGAAGEEGI